MKVHRIAAIVVLVSGLVAPVVWAGAINERERETLRGIDTVRVAVFASREGLDSSDQTTRQIVQRLKRHGIIVTHDLSAVTLAVYMDVSAPSEEFFEWTFEVKLFQTVRLDRNLNISLPLSTWNYTTSVITPTNDKGADMLTDTIDEVADRFARDYLYVNPAQPHRSAPRGQKAQPQKLPLQQR